MSRLRTALLIVGAIAALDVGLAQIAKRMLPQWYSTMPASNPRMASPIYHHGLRPMMDVKTRVGPAVYSLATNSLGMVDAKPRTIDPRGKACRYLVIGDSFTEGFGVGWEKSFAGILAGRWAERGVDLLNAGVVSYSPTIYYRRIRHLIEDQKLQFGAAVVFIDMGDPSDEWRSYDLDAKGDVVPIGHVWQIRPMRDPTWRDQVRFWIQDNWVIAQLVKDLAGKLRKPRKPAAVRPGTVPAPPPLPHRPVAPLPLGEIAVPPPLSGAPVPPPGFVGTLGVENARWSIDPEAWIGWGREGTLVAAERMDRLALLLRQHNIKLTVAVYPWPDQLFAGDRDSAQTRFWREWARTRNAGFIDLFPAFFNGDDALTTIRRYFVPGDFHWNAAGHALVADRVDREIEPRQACR